MPLLCLHPSPLSSSRNVTQRDAANGFTYALLLLFTFFYVAPFIAPAMRFDDSPSARDTTHPHPEMEVPARNRINRNVEFY